MNHKNKYPSSGICRLAFAVIVWLITGCSYLSIPFTDDILAGAYQKDARSGGPLYNSAIIKGKFLTGTGKMKATLIAAFRLAGDGGAECTGYATVTPDGSFLLYLPQGRYQLYSLTDDNRDGVLEDSEVSGAFGSPDGRWEIELAEGALVTNVNIYETRASRDKLKLPGPFPFREYLKFPQKVTWNGQTQKIYSEYFSLKNAQTGYWHPSSFMQTFGAHIYLTEKYNPKKIPVLFVHGTEGTPHNWIYLYMRLDRDLYQPLFFYYPSGIRLSLAAAVLNEELNELRRKYGFSKIAVVAHSVGGLIARAFINRYASGPDNYVRLLVTFATPWGGFEMADASQSRPHKSIPAWEELGTKSSFIQTTMSESLPAHVRHYIFYGTKDVLAADKATDERAVSCAVKSLAFDCTHDNILIKRDVFEQFSDILKKELK